MSRTLEVLPIRNSLILRRTLEETTIIIPILWMGDRRLRKVKYPTHCQVTIHTKQK